MCVSVVVAHCKLSLPGTSSSVQVWMKVLFRELLHVDPQSLQGFNIYGPQAGF